MIESIHAFTPTFLTSILRPILSSSTLLVSDVTAEPLALMTAHTALLYRLHLTYVGECDGGPASLIAKLPKSESGMAENARIFQPGTKEAWFYRRIAPLIETHVPKCISPKPLVTPAQPLYCLKTWGI